MCCLHDTLLLAQNERRMKLIISREDGWEDCKVETPVFLLVAYKGKAQMSDQNIHRFQTLL